MKIAFPSLLLSFLVVWVSTFFLTPTLHHAYVAIDSNDGVQLHILTKQVSEKPQCEKQLAFISSSALSGCPTCRLISSDCISDLNSDQADWLTSTSLPIPTAGNTSHMVAFVSDSTEKALLNCRVAEAMTQTRSAESRLTCFESNVPRSLAPDFLSRGNAQNLAGSALAGLAVFLILLIFQQTRLRASHHPVKKILQKLTLVSADLFVLMTAYLLVSREANLEEQHHRTWLLLSGITLSWFWVIQQHYTHRKPFWDELREIFRTLGIVFLLACTITLSAKQSATPMIILWLSAFALIPLGRASARSVMDRFGIWERSAIIIGTGENAKEAFKAISQEKSLGYRVTAFICPDFQDCHSSEIKIQKIRVPVLKLTMLENQLVTMGNPEIIVGLDSLNRPESQRLIKQLSLLQDNIHIIPTIRGLPLFGTQLSHFFSHEVLFLTIRNNLARRGYRWIKRSFDLVAASIMLVFLSPIMGYVAFRIWREDGGPVIFKQARVGLDGKSFGFIKFRSMVKNADQILAEWKEQNSPEWQSYYANNFKLADDPRVLSVGKWIRSSSIDELPQLINVLKGEMSLVGPRPLLARELTEYGEAISLYEEARPGLTGLWQISGRSNTSFQDRANLDAWYVQNWSLWYDIAILFKTLDVVFNKKGAF